MNPTDQIAAWATRPVVGIPVPQQHALTVDVEDYFQVEAFSGLVDRESWDQRPRRIEENVDLILELFSNAGAHATFFTLGWIAERHPSVVRRIVDAGHEVASHGFAHHRADSQNNRQFLEDVSRAKKVLEDISGIPVNGYRAASFSINHRNLWAFDVLENAGYRYSSSLYPTRYIPAAPQFAFHPVSTSRFIEIPVGSLRSFGINWPCGGGGFFRLLPYWFSARNLRLAEKREQRPLIFYFHPWEIDPGQPRIKGAPLKTRVRHYTNIKRMRTRLQQLLVDFRWNRIDRLYPISGH